MVRFHLIASLTAIVVMSSATAATIGTRPAALYVTDVQDWGTIRPPKSGYVEADLIIRNQANVGNVQIVDVKPGCGCTTAEPAKRVLGPGEETTVHVKLNIAPTQNGPLQRNVTVRSVHESDTSAQVIVLKVDIARLVSVSPSGFVAINGAKVGVAAEANVTITNPGDLPLTITGVRTENGLTATLVDDVVLAPKEQRQVIVRYTPAQSGQFQSMLRFTARTNDESDEIQIPAYGTTVN